MSYGFQTPLDIAKRACQHLGVRKISSFTEMSPAASEASFLYDKVRRAELRRRVWTFAARRVVMRALSGTAKVVVPDAWTGATTYPVGALASDTNGVIWMSRQAGNMNQPQTDGSWWVLYAGSIVADNHDVLLTYYPGELVYSGTDVYIALPSAMPNLNHAPPNSTYWAPFDATFGPYPLLIPEPVGFSPDVSTSRSVYQLPYGFMRLAPQDLKNAGGERQSVSSGMRYNDWEMEHGLLVSATPGPFVLRFIADTTDVTLMLDLFAEAVSIKMACGMSERLTGSTEKAKKLDVLYAEGIADAALQNAIETGSTEDGIADMPPVNETAQERQQSQQRA